MALPSGLTYAALRALQLDALLDRTLDRDAVQAMAETLMVLLDEAQAADEDHASIDDLHGCIERLEKLRAEAVAADAKREEEADKKHDELRAALDKEKAKVRVEAADVAKTADEWRKRAERAEHEIAEQRSNVELALQRRKQYEDDARRLLTVLCSIANGRPEDAYRTARFALGRDIVEKTGTLVVLDDGNFAHAPVAEHDKPVLVVVPPAAAAADIPTRSQRRAQQSAQGKRKRV